MIQSGKELAAALKAAAENYKTLYVLGCFGWPMTQTNKTRVINAQSYNQKPEREAKIRAADGNTFGFDCVNLIKALLWGWDGSTGNSYGGAVYKSNGVPDVNADSMIGLCSEVTTDFSHILPGEAVWMAGHIGVYIGDGLAVECTARWKDGVQITAVHNIGSKAGYNGRSWTKHGKLPYLSYEQEKGDYVLELRNLKKGCKGEDVKALQILLLGNAYDCGDVDGIFGSRTETAVKACQKDRKLTVDGIAGENTMSSLLGVSGNE